MISVPGEIPVGTYRLQLKLTDDNEIKAQNEKIYNFKI